MSYALSFRVDSLLGAGQLMQRTAKRFNFCRHYADNNLADLLPDKIPEGRSCFRNTYFDTKRGISCRRFPYIGLLERTIVPIGTTGDQLLHFNNRRATASPTPALRQATDTVSP